MIKLAAEHLKICPFSLALAGLKIISLSALSQQGESETNVLFGMGRKATGTMPFPCPCQEVFVMFPSDAYTGWYSWPPVPMDTVILSLPVMIRTNIDPRISSS